MNKTFFTLLLCATISICSMAQNSYLAEKPFDGEYKNEISGYVMGGTNVVTDAFGGLAAYYDRHLTPRWHVGGAAQAQFGQSSMAISTSMDA